MLRQVMVPSKENSTISIPTEYYGQEVEIVVYPIYSIPKDKKLEAYNNLLKFRGTLKRDIDYKSERNSYLDEKYGSVN
ncbi:MAG: hypothetical protein LBH25_10155 [Fibromonadaceae bacterium]|nr:hypothetical protein [Fibromonadaceae bacterium]